MSKSRFGSRLIVCTATLLMTLLVAGCGGDESPESQFTEASPGCLVCHGAIEIIHESEEISCTRCHGGDFESDIKDVAHVLPSMPIINDSTVPPLDYDLPYQRFVNPTNLRVVGETCGACHADKVSRVKKSMMATTAGHHAGGLYLNGVQESKTPIYGTFRVVDDDGVVPPGAVAELQDLISYDPSLDQDEYATHYRAVPRQACARCHLWSRGKGYRGADDRGGIYRADGCAACHMLYDNDGLSQSADTSINHEEPGHPRAHKITTAIDSDQCIHCHHRGSRIGLTFTGRSQMPPRLPSGPGIAGTTDVRFNRSHHYSDPEINPADVHFEAGMHCIDCHTAAGVMGDNNIYGHQDQATKVQCVQCHGTLGNEPSLRDLDGLALNNMQRGAQGSVVLTSKVTGNAHQTPRLTDFLDPNSPNFNADAAAAMDSNHLKVNGGLECDSCHTDWMPNCFGCHFERDETKMGLDLFTGIESPGKASTNNKMFVSLKHFSIGYNAEGRAAPFMVGCQPIADVTAPDGSKILDFKFPETSSGKSGAGHNPVVPHAVAGPSRVRACVECHRSPPSLGLGSGNYSLGRGYVFAVAQNGVHVFDRETDPSAPIALPRIAMPVGVPRSLVSAPNIVDGSADYLFVGSSSGLYVFDMRAGVPTEPIATIPGIDVLDVSRASRYLYAVVAGVGVQIYDTLDPSLPTLVTTVAVPTAVRVEPWGIHLYIAAGSQGLAIVDVGDHDNPQVIGTVPGINAASDIRLYAHHQAGPGFAARAYVADPGFGVHIVDLLPNFAEPTLIAGIPLLGAAGIDTYTRYREANSLLSSKELDYLYVAAGDAGLFVYDISEPDDITIVSSLDAFSGEISDVDVFSQIAPPGVDDYAIVANTDAGIAVVDVTNPSSMSILTTVGDSGVTRVYAEVFQLDRYVDEQGNELAENSHEGARAFSHDELVRILRTPLGAGAAP